MERGLGTPRDGRVFVCEYLSAGGAGPGEDALLAQGLAMRDALVADLLDVEGLSITLAQAAPDAPASITHPRVHAVAPAAGEPWLDFVRRQAASHARCWIVAPESGGLLAAVQAAVGAPRWIGCDAASIALASRKRATLERLARHGVATPLAFADAATHWVVKPDDGAGAVATRRHATRAAALAEWRQRARAGEAAVLEPWVEGEPLSLSLRCAAGRAELLAVNRQRIEIDAQGCVAYEGVARDAAALRERGARLSALADAVARALPGLAGYVGVDLVWHARGPVAIEVNPRLTCAYVGLSAALGRNLAREILDDAPLRCEAAHA